MQPLNSPSFFPHRDKTQRRADGALVPTRTSLIPASKGQLLTPAQRTTLERLIVKIMAHSPAKSVEIWASLRHQLGVNNGSELMASHFRLAEQLLQARLNQAQDNHANRQLLQQLTDLLPQGNNRQAVSDFIRQQFGHTVLSQLSHQQLRQVLATLQSGELVIPAIQQTAATLRFLLPAEHQHLHLLVAKLSATTGEQPAKIWQTLFDLIGVKKNDPLPAQYFQLLSQFLQVKIAISQQQLSLTLTSLQTVLKQPADSREQQLLADYCLNHFKAGLSTPLTQLQLNELINLLFASRLKKIPGAQAPHEYAGTPHLLFNPLIAVLPESWQSILKKPSFIFMVAIIVTTLLLVLVL